MLNSIGILIGGANKLGSYLKKLILTFQARVTIDSGSFEGYDCMESLLKQNNKSILDKASLIITPNAYKEGKIYSVVPTDGSGDLSVVRATTATRVNSTGLIEDAPYNLFSYSEEFNNAYWIKIGSSVLINNVSAPNGTLTAEKIIENNSNSLHSITKYTSWKTVSQTVSFYVKSAERTKVLIKCELNNVKAYINGALAYTTTFANPQLMTILQLLTIQNESSGMYKAESILAFKTALTDQECIQLTTI